MKPLLLLAVLLGSGCGEKDPEACRNGDYICFRRKMPIGEQRNYCVNEKIDHMSDADHVQSWGGDLVRALHEVCEKMYPEKKP